MVMGKRFLLRRVLRPIVTLKGSPESIALGVALGVFFAFTPTVGLQMVLSAFVATLLGASRPAAITSVWITNPLTFSPIYALTYWLGRFFWSGPSVAEVRRQLAAVVMNQADVPWYALHKYFIVFLQIGVDVFLAMAIGGALIGGVCAVLSYPLALRVVLGYRHARQARREARRKGDDPQRPGGKGGEP